MASTPKARGVNGFVFGKAEGRYPQGGVGVNRGTRAVPELEGEEILGVPGERKKSSVLPFPSLAWEGTWSDGK